MNWVHVRRLQGMINIFQGLYKMKTGCPSSNPAFGPGTQSPVSSHDWVWLLRTDGTCIQMSWKSCVVSLLMSVCRCFGVQGTFAWQKSLSTRKKINSLVKSFFSGTMNAINCFFFLVFPLWGEMRFRATDLSGYTFPRFGLSWCLFL